MSIPQHHINKAKSKMEEINHWFQTEVTQNPSAVLSLVAERGSRVERDIYAVFRNERKTEYERERDDNTLTLSCRAGRGRMFEGVPRDSKSGTVESDNSDWVNVPEENRVDVHNSIAGDHAVNVAENRSRVHFSVSCRGVAFEDTTRGHGTHHATLHAIFGMTEDAIADHVNLEMQELGQIIGV